MSNTLSGDIGIALPNTLDNENIIDSSLIGYLPVDGSGQMDGDLNMNGHNIINLDTPINPLDGVNKSYVDTSLSNYVTLNTNQTITAIKTFGPHPTEGSIRINKASSASFAFIRFLSNNVNLWDYGAYQGNNNIYWYYTPTNLNAMTLTTSGRLGIGTFNPLEKLQIDNGSIIIDRTDNLPAGIAISTNSNSSGIGSTVSLASNASRASGIRMESNGINPNKRFYFGRPYDGGVNTESRLVVSYVNIAGQDPAVERTGAGIRQYTPMMVYDGDNSRVGFHTLYPSVPLDITGNTKINSGTLDMTNNKIINVLDPTNNQDVATKIYVDTRTNNYLPLGGGTMSGNINMNSNKITNLLNGTLSSDAINLGQLTTTIGAYLPLAGGTMTGAINLNSNKITNLSNGTLSSDAVNLGQLDTKLNLSGGTMTGAINMGSNKISNLSNGTLSGDAVNKSQLDTKLNLSGGTMTGDINMNNNNISGVQTITISDSAVFGVNPRISGFGNTLFLRSSASLTNYLSLETGALALQYKDENNNTAFYIDTLNNRVGCDNGHDFITPTINNGNVINLSIGNVNKTTTITGSTTTITNLKAGSNIDANNNKIINLLDPTTNQDGATKKYVDDKIYTPKVSEKLSDFTWNGTDDVIYVTATSGSITMDIPYANSVGAGKSVRVIKNGAFNLYFDLVFPYTYGDTWSDGTQTPAKLSGSGITRGIYEIQCMNFDTAYGLYLWYIRPFTTFL